MKPLATLALVAASLLPALAPAAETDAAALRACRGIADAPRRLACYDAMPLGAATAAAPQPAAPLPAAAQAAAASPVTTTPAPTPVPTPAPALAAAAVPLASAVPAAVAAVAAVPATRPAAPSRSTEAEFGLEAQRAAEITQISSRIDGTFEGWQANSRIRLANGQVWQVMDGTSASYYLKDPKVTIARAALGSFRLEIEGARQAPRVRRVE